MINVPTCLANTQSIMTLICPSDRGGIGVSEFTDRIGFGKGEEDY